MTIKIRHGNSLWDKIRGKNFVPHNYYNSVHDIVEYNPIYLSVNFNLKTSAFPGMTVVTASEHINHHPDLRKTRFANMLPEFDEHEKRPWFIVDGQTHLLAKLQFTGKELEALKGQEVAFYFYEPLFQVAPPSIQWPAHYDRNTDVLFPELIWLEQFLKNHDHAFTAVAYVCDYRLEEEYLIPKAVKKSFPVKTWDIFVQNTITHFYWEDLYHGPSACELTLNTNFTKKFICPNFRYANIREVVVAFLQGSTYAADGHISFFFDSNDREFLDKLPFDTAKLTHWPRITEGRNILKNKLPLVMDTHSSQTVLPQIGLPDLEGGLNNRTEMDLKGFYQDAFLAIVNESRFACLCGEISEKVLMPIRFHRPFVVIGGPYMLRYLREQGFETFSEFWDESYDEIEDHGLRLEAIFKILDSILHRPLEELKDLYNRMRPIIERNRNYLLYGYRQRMYENLSASQRSLS